MIDDDDLAGGAPAPPGARARLLRSLLVTGLAVMLAVSAWTWMSPRVATAGPRALPGSTAGPPARSDAAPPGRARPPAGKLDLNTATAEELETLPGIGPAKAERIVTWRSRHGPFRRVADLRKVKGFGYKTFKKLEPYLDVKRGTAPAARPRPGGRAP